VTPPRVRRYDAHPPPRGRVARLLRRARLRTLRAYRNSAATVRGRLFAPRLGRLGHHEPKPLEIPGRYRRRIKLDHAPTISIVTASSNRGEHLGRTISSVLDQGYPRLEYIVSGAGWTDEAAAVLAEYAARLHHPAAEPGLGFTAAVNLGFRHASGEIMAVLPSGDMLLPGSLGYVARYLSSHPEVDAAYGHRVLVDANDMEIGRWVLPRQDDEVISWVDFVPLEGLFWRTALWHRVGGALDPKWSAVFDWDLLLRFRDAGAKIVRLPRFLGAFRGFDARRAEATDARRRNEEEALRRHIHGRAVTRDEIESAIGPYMRRHVALQKLYRVGLLRY
jgi:glycosyltransferase involved in cell wall biosynthesis